jgi:UDP-N-acetylmuramate: L-alanyl-gamma-D-glutamyl-meso-diaminopimelate ligase
VNPEKNRIPDNVQRIHLIAVCGTAMGALACMLKDMGYQLTGSDEKVYPPMSNFLRDRGIQLIDGFDGANLDDRPDLVIVGNAVRKDNPEVVKADQLGLYYCSMPQALNGFAAEGKKPVLVTGTHGKTTTASLMAWVLYTAGLDPSFMIGGILKNFDSNYRLGRGLHVVIEGDEYDTAFFDKGAKFMHYRPDIAILTSIEFDHADIFRDLAHVRHTFRNFVERMPRESTLIAYDDDADISAVLQGSDTTDPFVSRSSPGCHVARYGKKADSGWRLEKIQIDPPWNCFEVVKEGKIFGAFKTRMVGEHNLLNALSVIAAADRLGIAADTMGKALSTFEGVRRRQEVRGGQNGVTVMDDFAHHPTAVRETLAAVRPFYPGGRVIAIFEPRTNSSMRRIFQDAYPLSFDAADVICIREPSMIAKIPPSERFSSRRLVEDLQQRGKSAHYFPNTDAILDFMASYDVQPGDLVLVMSNGGFDNIHDRLLRIL